VVVTQAISIRWFIVIIAVVGVCCAVVGTVLGAMKASGREHLTVSLLLIGESEFTAAVAKGEVSDTACNQTQITFVQPVA
jgi:hypothetical protein